MPYSSVSEVPSYVPKAKRKQWMDVWNSVFHRTKDEQRAFASANSVAGPSKAEWSEFLKAVGTKKTGFVRAKLGPFKCGHCRFMKDAQCHNEDVLADPEVKAELNADGFLPVESGDCCNEYEPTSEKVTKTIEDILKAGKDGQQQFELVKTFDFLKVDEKNHTVTGVASSETPDKDGEIADYQGTKAAFTAWSEDFLAKTSAAGQDKSLGNIRMMHTISLGVAGKATAIRFDDEKKQVILTTQPLDDGSATCPWALIKGGFLTGFSIGGKYAKKVRDGEFKRYWPVISETSYVDNPCNPDAAFTYVKADGSMQLCKVADLRKDAAANSGGALSTGAGYNFHDLRGDSTAGKKKKKNPDGTEGEMEECEMADGEVKRIAEAVVDLLEKEAKTKRVAGEDLPASAFAYVGDKNDTSTWKLPIKFSSDEKTKSHIRNALARFGQTQGIPEGSKASVRAKIVRAAKQHGVEVSEKAAKALAYVEQCYKSMFVFQNAELQKMEGTLAEKLDSDLFKSMWDVAQFAEVMDDLYFLCLRTRYEAQQEGDGSKIPDQLHQELINLASIFTAYVEEETEEITAASEAAQGELYMTAKAEELEKAAEALLKGGKNPLKAHFTKAAAHHAALSNKHEAMAEHNANMAEKMGDENMDGKAIKAASIEDLEKRGNVMAAHFKKASAHHAALAKRHDAHSEHLAKLADSLPDVQGGSVSGKGGATGEGDELEEKKKAAAAELAKKAADEKAAADKAAEKAAADAELAKAAAGNEPLLKAITAMGEKFEAGLGEVNKSVKAIEERVEKLEKTPVETPVRQTVDANGRPQLVVRKGADDKNGEGSLLKGVKPFSATGTDGGADPMKDTGL